MTTWLEVAIVAFVAQLSVLPGEKGQFVIAALATRFHPLVVVAGAGAAFGGWTVLEILLGSYLQQVLPEVYLEVLTGLLFLLFAVMLYRTAPPRDREPHVVEDRAATTDGGEASEASRASSEERSESAGGERGDARTSSGARASERGEASEASRGTSDERSESDGGASTPDAISSSRMLASGGGELDVRLPVVGWRVPSVLGGFLPAFALMTVGEFGDKTQLVTIGLATQFATFPTAIWVGEMAAIVPVSLANAYFFHRFAGRFDLRTAHLAGAVLFAFFGVDILQAQVTGVPVWETVVETIGEALASVLSMVV